MTLIAPSILSADFSKLGDELRAIEKAGADWVHVDVMDGHYVPNITIGPMIVAAAKRSTQLPLDVHLMITEPERYVDDFIDAGASGVTVHVEACVHLERTLQHLRSRGVKAGVSLNPSTSPERIKYVAHLLDVALVMSVNPGFGGQSYIETSAEKVREVRALLKARENETALIEVDGGVSEKNARELVEAGADVLVAGSAIYKRPPYDKAIAAIRKACA